MRGLKILCLILLAVLVFFAVYSDFQLSNSGPNINLPPDKTGNAMSDQGNLMQVEFQQAGFQLAEFQQIESRQVEFQNPGQGNRPGLNPDRRMDRGAGMAGRGTPGDAVQYASQVSGYALVFFGVFILAYYYRPGKGRRGLETMAPLIVLALLAGGLVLRIYLATLISGHPYDIRTFQSWATTAAQNLFQVYAGGRSSDYPPLYIYVLALIGQAAKITFLQPYFTLLLKLPSILADLLTSLLLYQLAGKRLSKATGLGLAAFYIFNPAIFINSAVWGQADSFFTLLIVGAVLLLAEKKPVISSVLFAVAVLMKPQGIIFLPVLFFELWRKRNLRLIGQSAAAALAAAVVIILPFALHFGPLWIFRLFQNTLGEYPYASLNAFNFFGLLGANYVNDASGLLFFSYHTWGMIAIVGVTLLTWYLYHKKQSPHFGPAAALLLMAGVFMFSARMHERYLFPVVALAALAFIYWQDKRLWLLAGGFSLTVYVNTHYVLYQTGLGGHAVGFNLVLMLTSLFNIGLFAYLVKVLRDIVIKNRIVHFPEASFTVSRYPDQ